MRIQLDKQFTISTDQHNWILNKVDSTGKFRSVGYFISLQNLLEQLIQLKLKASGATSFVELRNELNNIKKWLEQALNTSKLGCEVIIK